MRAQRIMLRRRTKLRRHCLALSLSRSSWKSNNDYTVCIKLIKVHRPGYADKSFNATTISKSSSNYNNPLMAKLRAYPDKSGSNQYQRRHFNPPDERRINMGNPGLNFLIRQIQIENLTRCSQRLSCLPCEALPLRAKWGA